MPVFETGTFNHSVTCPHDREGSGFPRGFIVMSHAPIAGTWPPSRTKKRGNNKETDAGREFFEVYCPDSGGSLA